MSQKVLERLRSLHGSKVIATSHFRGDDEALEHVRRNWRFDPATRDGAAVATWGAFGVTFAITR